MICTIGIPHLFPLIFQYHSSIFLFSIKTLVWLQSANIVNIGLFFFQGWLSMIWGWLVTTLEYRKLAKSRVSCLKEWNVRPQYLFSGEMLVLVFWQGICSDSLSMDLKKNKEQWNIRKYRNWHCKCWPMSLFIEGSLCFVWIVVLNCHKCYTFQKCQKSSFFTICCSAHVSSSLSSNVSKVTHCSLRVLFRLRCLCSICRMGRKMLFWLFQFTVAEKVGGWQKWMVGNFHGPFRLDKALERADL